MFVDAFIQRSGGIGDGLGRYLRKSDSTRHYGFINLSGVFNAPSTSTLQNGDTLEDLEIPYSYLLADFHKHHSGFGEDGYTGRLFECNVTADLYRFNDSDKNSFGYAANNLPDLIEIGIPGVLHTGPVTVQDLQDRFLLSGKSKMLISASIEVLDTDRVSTATQDFRVLTVDRALWDGYLQVLFLEPDRR